MAKTLCLFVWVKRIFNSDPKNESKNESKKKSKKWRWVIERFKINKKCHVIAAAAPQTTLIEEATDERRRQALSVAVATAAAAEAAVAAANAAAEVVRLTRTTSRFYCPFSRSDRNSAATKIQSCFRGYLARKALRALKGIVKLQAIVRGRAARRRIQASLNRSITEEIRNSKVVEKRNHVAERSCNSCGKKVLIQPRVEFEEDELKFDLNSSLRNWDGSSLSKESMEALQLKKQEAIIRRERMMKYSFSHREGRNGKMSEDQSSRKIISMRQTNIVNDEEIIMYGKNENSLGRRSFCHLKQYSSSSGNYSPIMFPIPTYMAVTESAKAKTRSMSTPKQRLSFLNDLSFWPSNDTHNYDHV